MRSHDFFGRKIRRSYSIRLSLVLILLIASAYFGLDYYQSKAIQEAKILESTLEQQLDKLSIIDEHGIEYQTQSLSVQIPKELQKYEISKELEFAYSASGMETPSSYRIVFTDNFQNSLYENKPEGIVDVKIDLDFTTTHPEYLAKYLQYILDTNHKLVIQNYRVTFVDGGTANVSLQLAAFYEA